MMTDTLSTLQPRCTLRPRAALRSLMLGAAVASLAACNGQDLDWDLRQSANTLNTTDAARQATAAPPVPDARGVISYPTYQVAVAQRGDTVASLAARIGLDAGAVARYNGLNPEIGLRQGEVLALPSRVAEPLASTTSGVSTTPITGGAAAGSIDITSLASGAIDRSGDPTSSTGKPQGVPGREPIRHQVLRGETAFTIARLYNVSAKALADWNGLGPDLAVREGQYLMIPVPGEEALDAAKATSAVDSAAPGTGSATPLPPSASKPLPDEKPVAAAAVAGAQPASPNLATQQTAASATRFAFPADGKIIRAYDKGKNEGIDIGAAAGSPVRAAADGTVAAITQDTDQVPILVIRHDGGVLTVYANIDGIKVAKGAAVKRGQIIATVRAGSPAFLHFEVRQGFDSTDPMPFLQ